MASPITYQKKSLFLQIKVLKYKIGHSERANDISFLKAQMSIAKPILTTLISALHFLLRVLNMSVEKGLVCSEADGSLSKGRSEGLLLIFWIGKAECMFMFS